jgi:hypothetical protein
MDKNKYLQLSISAFITAVVIGLGWIFGELQPMDIDWIKVGLLGISVLFGLYFFYKYKTNDSKTEGLEWVNYLVERMCEALPEIPVVLPLIVGVIIVTQNITKIETPDLSPITAKLSTNEQTLNNIATEIHNMSSYLTTEESFTKCPTSTPITCVTCCATSTPSATYTPTPTVVPTQSPTHTKTSTQILSPTPSPEIRGCVITYALNVRNSPGVIEDPSNHARIWLRNKACMTILKTETDTPEWAYVRFNGWVRLNIGETEYVVVIPSTTPTPTPKP